MDEIDKYSQLKAYLSVNGYNTLKELATDWDITYDGLRNYCQDNYKSARLDKLYDQFIKEGDRKLTEHRKKKVALSH